MAVSAFKSNSKRGNLGSSSSNITSSAKDSELTKKVPPRRSRSVSAVVRNCQDEEISTVDFLNKRDNPLFCCSSTSPPEVIESENAIGIAKFNENASRLGEAAKKSVGSGCVSDSRRGRSVTRHADYGNQSLATRGVVGRSLSRVDTGRRGRSVSKGHYGNSESEVEKETSLSSGLRNKNNVRLAPSLEKKAVVTTCASELSDQTRNLQRWSSQHPLLEPSDGSVTSNLEDEISTGSFSEAEEKTIGAVFEQIKSFQTDQQAGDSSTGGIYETVRSELRRAISEIQNDLENVIRRNCTTIGATNVVDIPPELVNPDAIELVSDIRKEYASKLEQSQERARKLQAELAIEEHRGQELNRILKEILPDPKSLNTQKPQPRRKTSIERRKMSKRLTEEAMNYFDECVSISTFDSSDFSSPEDPPLNSVAATSSVGDSRFLLSGNSSASTSHCSNFQLNCNKDSDGQVFYTPCKEGSVLTAGSCYKDPGNDQRSLIETDAEQVGNFQFSFSHEPMKTKGLFNEIKSYIKKFEKETENNERDCQTRLSSYNADDYESHFLAESLLFDRVIFKNRIQSGSLLLCASGIVI
ncbi:uncharacterized protein LOC122089429 isoform X2 [Macadamia integrifolia]|uniref:uncharacterized protein LOC122089429 isoform X2 n=1 Tax=Macadamia integrifolia TaxID=60698 RepID=UPI001C4FB0A6|nr:uncharacterized protein LOC122089429 isoform X2 [Macadamia integrifolia]